MRVRLGLLAAGTAAVLAPSAAHAFEVVQDGGFEQAVPMSTGPALDSPAWTETDSISTANSPLCNATVCGEPNDAHQGQNWAWFGGFSGGDHSASLTQTFELAGAGSGTLAFHLKLAFPEAAAKLTAHVDGATLFTLDSSNAPQFGDVYNRISVPVPQLAAGSHTVSFAYRETGPGTNNVFVDDVSLDFVPSNAITLGKVTRNTRKGTAKIAVTVPGAGLLGAAGKQVKSVAVPTAAPGATVVSVKPTGKAKRRLAREGRAKVKVTIGYTPTAGTPALQTRIVKLKQR